MALEQHEWSVIEEHYHWKRRKGKQLYSSNQCSESAVTSCVIFEVAIKHFDCAKWQLDNGNLRMKYFHVKTVKFARVTEHPRHVVSFHTLTCSDWKSSFKDTVKNTRIPNKTYFWWIIFNFYQYSDVSFRKFVRLWESKEAKADRWRKSWTWKATKMSIRHWWRLFTPSTRCSWVVTSNTWRHTRDLWIMEWRCITVLHPFAVEAKRCEVTETRWGV